VVLIEPDASVRDALAFLLQGEGWTVNSLDGCDGLTEAIADESVVAEYWNSAKKADCRSFSQVMTCRCRVRLT